MTLERTQDDALVVMEKLVLGLPVDRDDVMKLVLLRHVYKANPPSVSTAKRKFATDRLEYAITYARSHVTIDYRKELK